MEKEFIEVLKDLEIDRQLTKKHLAMDKSIRRELIKLYKKVKKFEEKAEKRKKLAARCNAYQSDYPNKSLEILTEIEQLDDELMPEIDELGKEIGKHCLPDVADVFKTLQLSAEDIKHIRSLALNISSRFGIMAGDISSSVNSQQTEMTRRQILKTHPDLAKG